MFGLFQGSSVKKMRQQHEAMLTRAFQAQRNGDIRQYSMLTAEAESLREKIEALEKERTS